MTSIKVICRLRPLNKKEMGLGGETCVVFNDTNINVNYLIFIFFINDFSLKFKVKASDQKYDFSFDRIFGPDSV